MRRCAFLLVVAVMLITQAAARTPPPRVVASLPSEACVQVDPTEVLLRLTDGEIELARCVVRHASRFSAFHVRAAVLELVAPVDVASLSHLANILEPASAAAFDAVTRGYAASAVGRTRSRRCT